MEGSTVIDQRLMPPLTDAELEHGWRQMLTEEQTQGMVIVVARSPAP